MSDVSVIILTFNEEKNLPDCLDSVKGWAREVFVVDSYSTDKTVDLALARAKEGVKVVQHRFENYSAQWNWALQRLPLKGAWTLKLDGDERVTEAFKRESDELFQTAPATVEGVMFRRRFFFLGKGLHWGPVRGNYDLRMWRTGKAVFQDRAVNEHAQVKGERVKFKSLVEHRDNKELSDWIEKHNRYSSLEAKSLIAGNYGGWKRKMFWQFPLGRHFLFFLFNYVFRLGFLDGPAGFQYAFLQTGFLTYLIDLKRQEGLRTGEEPEVFWPARGVPHPRVAGSALQKSVDGTKPRKSIRREKSQ